MPTTKGLLLIEDTLVLELDDNDVHDAAKQLIGAVNGGPTDYDTLPTEKKQGIPEAKPAAAIDFFQINQSA